MISVSSDLWMDAKLSALAGCVRGLSCFYNALIYYGNKGPLNEETRSKEHRGQKGGGQTSDETKTGAIRASFSKSHGRGRENESRKWINASIEREGTLGRARILRGARLARAN